MRIKLCRPSWRVLRMMRPLHPPAPHLPTHPQHPSVALGRFSGLPRLMVSRRRSLSQRACAFHSLRRLVRGSCMCLAPLSICAISSCGMKTCLLVWCAWSAAVGMCGFRLLQVLQGLPHCHLLSLPCYKQLAWRLTCVTARPCLMSISPWHAPW